MLIVNSIHYICITYNYCIFVYASNLRSYVVLHNIINNNPFRTIVNGTDKTDDDYTQFQEPLLELTIT